MKESAKPGSDASIGTDGSEQKYTKARPPAWDKSERADKNLPSPKDSEWDRTVTKEHPAKQK